MSNATEVDLQITGARATITFRSANGVNVLSPPTLEALGHAVARVADAPHVSGLVLRAEGKVFIAGADIKSMTAFSRDQAIEMSRTGHRVFDALARLHPITVAAISGVAAGGGLETALACDFRLAVRGVLLGLPETSLGLIPGWGGTKRLAALIGPAHAKRLMFSARLIKAEEALELGLVDQIVDDAAQLDAAVDEWFRQFAKGGPQAVALVKRAMHDGDESDAFGDCFETRQAREGMTAFIEKRSPSWVEEPR